jgi:hypothetical protein
MARSMRRLTGGASAAVVVLAALAGAAPAQAGGSFSCTATGAESVAARIVEPFTQANPAGVPCRAAAARSSGALIPAQAGQEASATIRARTRAHRGRVVARASDRDVSLVLDGHTYSAALVRATAVVRCRAGVPVISSAAVVRRLRIDGGAPFDVTAPRTIVLGDGTQVLLDQIAGGPPGTVHVTRTALRVVTPPVPQSFSFAAADAGATADACAT